MDAGEVAVEARDDVAEARPREVLERQALEVLEEVSAHVQEDQGGRRRVDPSLEDAEREAEEGGAEDRRGEDPEQVRPRLEEDAVDELLDEPGV